jgi:hypothetical protein
MARGLRLLLVAQALALAGCGSTTATFVVSETTVPFQAPATSAAYNAASASASFTSGVGIAGTGAPEPADTAGNTVTVTTDSGGGVASITVTTAAVNGGAPTSTSLLIQNGVSGIMADANTIAFVIGQVAVGGPAATVYQGATAQLSFSAYGVWAVNTGGANYNVGVYALGSETTPAQMAALVGAATYTGSSLGFGANGATPFAFTGSASISVNFTSGAVTNLTLSNFNTVDIGGGAGPVLPTLIGAGGAGTIAASKYAVAIAGGTLAGNAVGTFYGPTANETAGTFEAAGGGISLIGAFGAHH